jgi:glycerate 2-kinase
MISIERQTIAGIFHAAVQSVNPYDAVARHVDEITSTFKNGKYQRMCVLAFGKAAPAMARALIESVGEIVTDGIIITKDGHTDATLETRGMQVFEAAHPVPDERGVRATLQSLRLLEKIDERTCLICLISGGGSALLVAPCPGLSLDDKQKTTELLLKCGADIHEMNAVRKHISRVKGGRLAAITYPARIESFILSDVLGDRLDVIASGPTAPDNTTYADALGVIEKYRIVEKMPSAVLHLLKSGAQGLIPETPKPGDPIFDMVRNRIVGNNKMAINAAREKAEQLGFEVMVINEGVRGEAREVGRELARRAIEIRDASCRDAEKGRPVCMISGGETTVTVRGRGRGGRNMELALAFAIEANGQSGITFLSAGTDGGDGPTDAAGAIVDGYSIAAGRSAGMDPMKFLQNNDSYSYFKKTDELLITGPTGTNVMDLQIVLLQTGHEEQGCTV